MDQEKIGKFIAKLRKDKNMTQEELAERLGVNSRSVSRWENGKCMPDLSLLVPLSKELDTNVNDLMSGEAIDKKDYQEKFEENVVDMVSNVAKHTRFSNLLSNIFLGIIIVFTICFTGYIFFVNFSFKVGYNKDKMFISNDSSLSISNYYNNKDDLVFCTKNNYIGTVNRLTTTYKVNGEEIGIIFVHVRRTLENIYQEHNAINDYGNYNLTTGRTCSGLFVPDEFPSHYKVYYTKESFNKIANASNSKLGKIIDHSNLMYESSISES